MVAGEGGRLGEGSSTVGSLPSMDGRVVFFIVRGCSLAPPGRIRESLSHLNNKDSCCKNKPKQRLYGVTAYTSRPLRRNIIKVGIKESNVSNGSIFLLVYINTFILDLENRPSATPAL